MKKKKETTIEDLAMMTQRGFSEMDKRFSNVDREFKEAHVRLDRIENLLIRAHENRLEKVEDDIRVLKTLVRSR